MCVDERGIINRQQHTVTYKPEHCLSASIVANITSVELHAKGQVCTTDHDVDLDRDGNARLDVLCLLIEVFAESTNVHSSLQVMGACMQARKPWTTLLSRSKQLE